MEKLYDLLVEAHKEYSRIKKRGNKRKFYFDDKEIDVEELCYMGMAIRGLMWDNKIEHLDPEFRRKFIIKAGALYRRLTMNDLMTDYAYWGN